VSFAAVVYFGSEPIRVFGVFVDSWTMVTRELALFLETPTLYFVGIKYYLVFPSFGTIVVQECVYSNTLFSLYISNNFWICW